MKIRGLPGLLWWGLALVIVASLANVWIGVVGAERIAPELTKGPQQVAHSYEVITAALMLREAVQDAERGQRGYLITTDPHDLEAYRTRSEEASVLLDKIMALTADDAEQAARWPGLQRLVNIKLAELKRAIDVRDREGFEAARQIVQADIAIDAMDAINRQTAAAVAAERERLTERLSRSATVARESRSMALAAGLLSLLVVLLGTGLVVSAVRKAVRSDRALQDANERFRHFVGNVKDYAIFTLDPKGVVLDWNAGAERIKGYAASEIVGQNFSRFYSVEDQEAHRPEQALRTAAEHGTFATRAWRVRKNGSRFLADIHLDALRDASGRLLGFVKITRDIDENVQQQQQLAQYQKMDALGQLTGGIAHDFNNFIHVIRNAAGLLERRLESSDPQVGTYLEMLKRNADRAASLTHRLLAFSRRQVLDPKPIHPNALIKEVSALLDQALGESVEVETVLGAGVWWICADVNQLETAVLNLALNARDAMPGGGKLTIEISNSFLDERYAAAHEEVTAGQYVMIAVSDTGTGMPNEVAARAFDPFFTTKEIGKGTGLGLSQVYGFIKQSGGHAKIYSEPGAGTTVKLYLPRLPGEAVPKNTAVTPAPKLEKGKEVVLVVEDDADVRAFTTELLSHLGYRVLAAGDAASALEVLDAHGHVDLLFTDVGLPGGTNGRELAKRALEKYPDLCVLYTTGYTRNAIIHHGRLDPGVALIGKPFTESALSEKVRHCLDQRASRAH